MKQRSTAISNELPKHVRVIETTEPLLGLVFIGDPHVWSHKPGRRRDVDYLGTILQKLIWIAEYCNEKKLYPIILGDLLDDSQDNDLHMMSRLVSALQHFKNKPLVLVGNHDISEKTLTPGTVLHLLHHTGQIEAIIQNGPHCFLTIHNNSGPQHILVGGTPYGESIPISLSKWAGLIGEASHETIKKNLGVDQVVWITHDDLAFDSSYPNSLALHPILGVDISVNGHMHRRQKPVQKGQTAWYNPGNINRLTIDLIDQPPKIWVYRADGQTEIGAEGLSVPLLEGITVPHRPGPEILSQEGRISTLEHNGLIHVDTTVSLSENRLVSQFVEHIKTDERTVRTDDGVFLASVIQDELNSLQPPQSVKNIISRLFEHALVQHREK